MRYAVAQNRRHLETLDYRYYLTEVIRLQAQGKTYGLSLYEMTHQIEHVDPQKILDDLVARAELEVVE